MKVNWKFKIKTQASLVQPFDLIFRKGCTIFNEKGNLRTKSNFSGGVQGGISNGEEIYFKVAFKPVATILSSQNTVNESGDNVVLKSKGRHDPCVVPRAVPIVEAMAALVIVDHLLLNRTVKL